MPDSTRVYLEFTVQQHEVCIDLSRDSICRIGRADQNTVILADDSVSRYHASIQANDFEQFLLADLGSQNGTFVDGRRVTAPLLLRDGNWIDVGGHRLTFRQETQAALAPSPGRTTCKSIAIRTVSVLVADIHDSTRLWSLAPEGASKAMAAFTHETGRLLRRENAWSQKFSGDGVMAVWVHQDSTADPGDKPAEAQTRILRSMLEIAQIASGLSERFALPFPLRIGAGVDRGEVVVGNFGGDGSADHTALGSAVNRAFRLEAATRNLNCDVLLSQSAYLRWREIFPMVHFRGERVSLKGFPDELTVYAGSFAQLFQVLSPREDKID